MEYIKNSLDDILNDLMNNKNLVEKFKSIKEEKELSKYHFNLGMYLRNSLNLWVDSESSKFFNSIGIFHPDDMSGIILTSLYRKIHNKDLELMKQAEFYKKYWTNNKD